MKKIGLLFMCIFLTGCSIVPDKKINFEDVEYSYDYKCFEGDELDGKSCKTYKATPAKVLCPVGCVYGEGRGCVKPNPSGFGFTHSCETIYHCAEGAKLKGSSCLTDSYYSAYPVLKLSEKQNIPDSYRFKLEYEMLNNFRLDDDYKHSLLAVNIPQDNPIEYIESREIINKIKNNESFYVFFGSKHCAWCRLSIEILLEEANKNNVEKIYYFDIFDDLGKDNFRNTYDVYPYNNQAYETFEGTKEYKELVELFKDELPDYKYDTIVEKRIYAPDLFKIENGKIARKITSTYSKGTEYEKLDEEDTEKNHNLFNGFFKQ